MFIEILLWFLVFWAIAGTIIDAFNLLIQKYINYNWTCEVCGYHNTDDPDASIVECGRCYTEFDGEDIDWLGL